MKFVVLSDLHFHSSGPDIRYREQSRNADIFLLRTVQRINRWIKPDLVILGGDLTNDPGDRAALEELAKYIKMLEMPVLVLRGNHDLPEKEFFSILPEPPDHLDVSGVRFVVFNRDAERPQCNAYRTPEEIARGNALADSFNGKTVFAQHVPLFTPGSAPSNYSYENAAEILAGGRAFLTVSGHEHLGFVSLANGGVNAICAPALCEGKFPYLVVTIDGDAVSVETENLALPDGYCDTHMHTRFAYCQENMDPARQLDLIRAFNLKKFALTEHSGHLYVKREDYWGGAAQRVGMDKVERQDRAKDYLALLDELRDKADFVRGMELDVDRFGNIMVLPEDVARVTLKVGAVHWIDAGDDREAMNNDFLMRTEALLRFGCPIIAHPFRVFSWQHPPVPEELFPIVAKMLKKYGAAAEINFHHNLPEEKFFKMCLEQGVKLTFGSDSHNLYELGEFYANLKFLEKIGGSKRDLISL